MPRCAEYRYPAILVARVKGLMASGMTAKGAAIASGLPFLAVRDWKGNKRCGTIAPDMSIRAKINAILYDGLEGSAGVVGDIPNGPKEIKVSYEITLSGKKEDARKAVEEQSDANIKAQTQSEESKASALKLLDALPDGVIHGTIKDHNNGNVDISVRVVNDPYAIVRAAAEVKTDTRTMPGAGAAGRPELAKGKETQPEKAPK